MDAPETGPPGAAWHPDPISNDHRLRWWAGDHWTAWVVDSAVSTPALAWCPEVGELLPPIQWGTPVLRVAAAPPLTFRSLPDRPAETLPALPTPAPALVAVAGAVAAPARRRRRRRHLVLLAAALLLIVPGAASAALLTPTPARPVLAPVVVYRDRAAGFFLLHPRSWRVGRANPGQGVQLVAGPARVPLDQLPSVSVATGAARGPLPSLADFEQAATSELHVRYPGLVLTDAADVALAGGLARRVSFTDASSTLTVLEIAGQTADQRPLTVTVTTPNQRYALSSSDLHDALSSIR
jgi:hypothetical protein